MRRLSVIAVAALLSSISWGAAKIPACEKRPDLIPQGRPLPNLKALPNLVFVARKASYYIESKSQGVQMMGEQSFIKGESRIICAKAEDGKSQSYSIYAPTLIDLTGEKTIGDSYWQFHMIANSKEFGIWNQKSRLFSKNGDLEESLSKIASQVQVFQISHDEYEIILIRESEQATETLAILFDSFSKIP